VKLDKEISKTQVKLPKTQINLPKNSTKWPKKLNKSFQELKVMEESTTYVLQTYVQKKACTKYVSGIKHISK